ncbi:MAG: M48 family metalloprotease [Methylobacteriaceae bacterium]|jgi:heat shock protein HtpX|nr:M48 family metalloprotease [Methylobacteriaceae bacterium]
MFEPVGLYTHILANRRRTVVYFTLFAACMCLGVYVLLFGLLAAHAGITGHFPWVRLSTLNTVFLRHWHYILAGLAGWTALTLLLRSLILYWTTGATRSVPPAGDPAETAGDKRFRRIVEELSLILGEPMPRLAVMETERLNAFASGLFKRDRTVTATAGLIDSLSDDELATVFAHELTHIKNRDVELMTFALVLSGIFDLPARALSFFRRGRSTGDSPPATRESDEEEKSGFHLPHLRARGVGAVIGLIVLALCIAFAWVITTVPRLAVSRSREYLADAGAVELTKNPEALINALLKISENADLPAATASVMAMCIENPRSVRKRLFSSHPSLESRIDAIVRHAGGRLDLAAITRDYEERRKARDSELQER